MELYNFAATVRRFIVYAAIGLAALFLLSLLYRLAVNIYLTLNPPPEPAPTVGFGKLPSLRLPSLSVEGNPSYLLETPTGELPTFGSQTTVVATVPTQPTLLGEEKARTLARNLDFGGQGELSTDKKTLTFRDTLDQRTLSVNVITQNFDLTTATSRIGTQSKGKAPSGPEAVEKAQQTLDRLGLLKFGFEEGNQTTTFSTISGGEPKKVSSTSEAQFTEVNFFRSLTGVAEESSPLLPPDPKDGLIRVWVTTGLKPDVNNILLISYRTQETEIDKNRTETYPLRNVSDAWEEIKERQGIAYVGVSGTLRTITVTRITLAYFDDPTHQEYLQPIYVFSGVARNSNGQEGEFVAYVSVISEDWVKE